MGHTAIGWRALIANRLRRMGHGHIARMLIFNEHRVPHQTVDERLPHEWREEAARRSRRAAQPKGRRGSLLQHLRNRLRL